MTNNRHVSELPNDAIDLAVLVRLREQTSDGVSDLVDELIEVFLHEVPQNCRRLDELYAQKDAAGLAGEAHRLRSSTGNLGAIRMTVLCTQLEEVARAGQLSLAGDILKRLAEELPRACTRLQEVLDLGSLADRSDGSVQPSLQ